MRRRLGFWRWIRRVLLGLVVVVAALAAAGAVYQAIATARDTAAFPPPGQMVDVGGHRLHIVCAGTSQPGTPTVILESGTGLSSPAWALVQASLAATTRVCAYDRAGNGWSEPAQPPYDARHVVADLHALLDRAGIAGPLVLVGHSFGGMYVRAFRDAYPADVVGLVLVDSSHPDQLARSPERSAMLATLTGVLRVMPWLARVGVIRLSGVAAVDGPDLPSLQKAELAAFGASPLQSETGLAELTEFPAVTDLLHKAASLGATPLFVLTSGKGADVDWPALQADLATLSTNSAARTIDTDHTGMLFSRAGAEAVSAAILAVLHSAASGQSLFP